MGSSEMVVVGGQISSRVLPLLELPEPDAKQ